MIDVPGATPSQLVLALGKDSNAYLLNRNNLGGIALPVTQANVGGINRGTSAVTYRTSQGTYFAFHNDENTIRAYRITATNPPTIAFAWSMSQSGRGSPWVTTTDGTNNVIVWVAGVGGDQQLHGYNGDTGAVIYAGGGANELMTGTRQFNTGMVARGRIYFGADNKVYAFQAARRNTYAYTYRYASPTPAPGGTNVAPILINGGVAKAPGIDRSTILPTWRLMIGDRLGLNWGNGGGWTDRNTECCGRTGYEIDFNASIHPSVNEIDFFTLQLLK